MCMASVSTGQGVKGAGLDRLEIPYSRRPIGSAAVLVERWPVHRLVACAARPRGVSAAVAEAGDMLDEDLVGAELVSVGAARLQPGHPLAVRRSAPARPAQHGAYSAAPYAISYISSRRPGSRRRIDCMRLVPCSARRCCCGPSPIPRTCFECFGRPRRTRW